MASVWRSEDSSQEPVLSLHNVGPRAWSQGGSMTTSVFNLWATSPALLHVFRGWALLVNCTQNRKIVRAIVGRSVQRTGQEESEGASLVKVLRPEPLSQDPCQSSSDWRVGGRNRALRTNSVRELPTGSIIFPFHAQGSLVVSKMTDLRNKIKPWTREIVGSQSDPIHQGIRKMSSG